MRKLALSLLVGIALMLAACGSGTSTTGNVAPTDTVAPPTATPTTPAATPTTAASGGATITMGSRSFTGGTATVKAGQAVTFSDPATTGGIHILVTGQNGTFSAETGAPAQFSSDSGQSFSPGTNMSVVFAHAGTYMITCKIHPTMEATITVTA